MTPALREAMHAVDVIAEVRLRLEHTGGVVELYHMARLSIDEMDLLVRLEVGAETHSLIHSREVPSTGSSADISSGCASSDSQAKRGLVAA